MRSVSQRQAVLVDVIGLELAAALATNSFIISVRPWRHSSVVLAARSTPTSWKSVGPAACERARL
jgi:hypothetical protein